MSVSTLSPGNYGKIPCCSACCSVDKVGKKRLACAKATICAAVVPVAVAGSVTAGDGMGIVHRPAVVGSRNKTTAFSTASLNLTVDGYAIPWYSWSGLVVPNGFIETMKSMLYLSLGIKELMPTFNRQSFGSTLGALMICFLASNITLPSI